MTCAICVSTVGPFVREPLGRNDAMVSVCSSCTTEPARAYSSVRGYEVPSEGMSGAEVDRRITAYARARDPLYGPKVPGPGRTATPGWIVVRVPKRTAAGVVRDLREAWQLIAHEPWARGTRYIGYSSKWVLFERPGARKTVSANPLAGIEAYRVEGEP